MAFNGTKPRDLSCKSVLIGTSDRTTDDGDRNNLNVVSGTDGKEPALWCPVVPVVVVDK